ncbi:MAG TPA: cation:proton antiporter [Thermoanaerobaculia bacterium]|nr:cation:proton antiporter [Thermoanaerobaculia bacterium]
MTLSSADLAHLVAALILLLAAAHGCGYLFRRFRQPAVLGEVLGGLLLGPTVFGRLLPGWQSWVFHDNLPTVTVLGAIYQLGLLLLMFSSGAEICALFRKGERKAAALITLTGTALPFVFGLLLLRFIDTTPYLGAAQNRTAFALVFAIGVAVTSIPVISRILYDLGLLETPFARIVLSAAVVEDVLLYVLVAIALSQVGGGNGSSYGVPGLLEIAGTSHLGLAYFTAVPLVFLLLSLLVGPIAYRWASSLRWNVLSQGSSIAYLLVILLLMTGMATSLGVTPMFGALMAGIVTGRTGEESEKPQQVIATFSFAFFIPIYFAIVGLKLDLIRAFSPRFFLLFLVFACVVKALSIYLGARLAGESRVGAGNLAVAMNARGGPGIVLASLAYESAIVSESFYTVLVMLSLVTSLLAGSWLDLVVRRGWKLR